MEIAREFPVKLLLMVLALILLISIGVLLIFKGHVWIDYFKNFWRFGR